MIRRYLAWRREVMRPQGTDTRQGTMAAELTSGAVLAFGLALLVGQGQDIGVLPALMWFFGITAAWSCTYVVVGALVDAGRRR